MPPSPGISHRVALFAITALIVVTRLPSLAYQRSIDDEAYYSVVASEMLHGGLPYQDAVDRKPPLLFAVYWAVFRVAGYPAWRTVHLVSLLWVLGTMALLYGIARRLFTPLTGAVAALLYGVFQPYLLFDNVAFNGEVLMNLPLAGAVFLAFRPSRVVFRADLLAAGALVALACLLKQPAGVGLAPLGVYCLHPGYARARGLPRWAGWFHGGLIGVGFAVVLAMTALILRQLGILQAAWYWSVVNHDVVHGPLDPVFWRYAARGSAVFALCTGPLLLGAWRSLHGDITAWEGRRAERDALVVFLAVSLIGVAASGRFFGHYFIQLLPPLVLLATPALTRSWRALGDPAERAWRRLTLGWTALSLLVTFGVHFTKGVLRPLPASEAARWVTAHSTPAERLFVWGQYPHLYYLSGRRPASRYISCFPLTGFVFGGPPSADRGLDTSGRIVPGAWDSLARDFERHPPKFIVDEYAVRVVPLYPMAQFPWLAGLVRDRYRLVARAADGIIYERDR
jgi:4-amino-4-deoxy-L-arabinose transferase-like glycosyltransferase